MVKKGFASVALSSLVLLLLVLSSVASSIAQADSDSPPGFGGDAPSGQGPSGSEGGDSGFDVPPGYSPPAEAPQASEGGDGGPSGPVDDMPSAAVYVPSSATPGSQIQVLVTGTDDKAVSQLFLFNEADMLTDIVECLGAQATCSQTFVKTVPSAFGASYVFRARAKDSAGQLSNVASASGLTTAAVVSPLPIITPTITPVTTSLPSAAPAPSGPVKKLQGVAVKFPLQPLFMRALSFADSDCVRPGESALLAVNVRNIGGRTLNDVKFSATVADLGIRASIGPFKLAKDDRSTHFLSINVPEDASEGAYFLRFVASNTVSNRIVHRIFTVSRSC